MYHKYVVSMKQISKVKTEDKNQEKNDIQILDVQKNCETSQATLCLMMHKSAAMKSQAALLHACDDVSHCQNMKKCSAPSCLSCLIIKVSSSIRRLWKVPCRSSCRKAFEQQSCTVCLEKKNLQFEKHLTHDSF